MKKVIEIVLLCICFPLFILSVSLLITDVPNYIQHFLLSSWETVATILIVIGFVNSTSVILFIIINNVQKSTSKSLSYERNILKLRLKKNLLLKELKELDKNESP